MAQVNGSANPRLSDKRGGFCRAPFAAPGFTRVSSYGISPFCLSISSIGHSLVVGSAQLQSQLQFAKSHHDVKRLLSITILKSKASLEFSHRHP